MTTIQIADKPTLDAVYEKVSQGGMPVTKFIIEKQINNNSYVYTGKGVCYLYIPQYATPKENLVSFIVDGVSLVQNKSEWADSGTFAIGRDSNTAQYAIKPFCFNESISVAVEGNTTLHLAIHCF